MKFTTTSILVCLLSGVVAIGRVHHRPREPAANAAIEPRIIGGTEVQPGDLPFLVAVLVGGGMCGGTLVNARTVVTAASCVDHTTSSSVRVVAGSVDVYAGEKFGVVKMIIHPGYNVTELAAAHDIAVLRLAADIEESDSTGYAKLPKKNTLPTPNTEGILAGWGSSVQGSYQSAQKASRINLPILPKEGCRDVFASGYEPEGIFCVKTQELRDACLGDNGAPLVSAVTGNFVGVLSLGSGFSCGNRYWLGVTWPIVFTSVGSHVDFINEHK